MNARSILGKIRHRTVSLTVAAALLLLFVAVSVPPAAEASVTLSEVTASASKTQHDPGKAARYWTPERMGKAIPLKASVPDPAIARATAALPDPPAVTPGYVDSVRPRTRKVPRIQTGHLPVPLANQISFRRYELKKTRAFPVRTHGKLFFRRGGSRLGYVCSATVISSAARNLLVTAGHCVHGGKGKGWHRNLVFVPGYRKVGRVKKPFGAFSAVNMVALNGWIRYSDWDYDFALVELKRNGFGQRVQNAVGARGVAWGQSRNQFFKSFGYPADKPFTGGRLYRCDSWYAGYGNSNTMGMGCDMTGGSSGGGWVIDEEYVNSVNSYGFTYQPRMMYGPYFGSSFYDLYKDYS